MYAAIMRVRHEFGFTVNTRVTTALSMGFVIAQAGERRFIEPTGQMMMHDLQAGSYGDTEQRYAAERSIDMLRNTVSGILAANNTGGHKDPQWWVENLFARERYFSPQEALELGVVDEVLPLYSR
jgi:ATP-dependent protease ClpP protease subunit